MLKRDFFLKRFTKNWNQHPMKYSFPQEINNPVKFFCSKDLSPLMVNSCVFNPVFNLSHFSQKKCIRENDGNKQEKFLQAANNLRGNLKLFSKLSMFMQRGILINRERSLKH